MGGITIGGKVTGGLIIGGVVTGGGMKIGWTQQRLNFWGPSMVWWLFGGRWTWPGSSWRTRVVVVMWVWLTVAASVDRWQ